MYEGMIFNMLALHGNMSGADAVSLGLSEEEIYSRKFLGDTDAS